LFKDTVPRVVGVPEREAAQVAKAPAAATAQKVPMAWPMHSSSLQRQPPVVVEGTTITNNMAGDLPAFLSALQLNGILGVMCLLAFLCLQPRFPLMYSYRNKEYWESEGDTKNPQSWDVSKITWSSWIQSPSGWFAPCSRSIKTTTEQVEHSCGLDSAMLLQFTVYAMQIMAIVGIPMTCIGIPIFMTQGGNFAKDDKLSHAGIGNIVYNSTDSGPLTDDELEMLTKVEWIWWATAFVVWLVVFFVQWWTFRWQKLFLERRQLWLDTTPEPTSTTILVQGIPEKYCTDAAFRQFMQDTFDDQCVKEAFVVKNTSYRSYHSDAIQIPGLISSYQRTVGQIAELDFAIEKKKKAVNAGEVDVSAEEQSRAELVKILDTQKTNVKDAQDAVQKDAEYQGSGPDDNSEAFQRQQALYTNMGFVTFKERKWCQLVVDLKLSVDADEWIMTEAPDQQDVLYDDLMIDEGRTKVKSFIGFGLLIALAFVYMPIILYINQAVKKVEEIAWLNHFLVSSGLKSTVDGTLASIGLTIMMSFLPTFIMWILDAFFVLDSEVWRQLTLQTWYFWFLLVFVLLISAIGTNLAEFVENIAESPFHIFSMFAQMLPVTSHFFLNYVVMQALTHCMNLTRYVQIVKFLMFKSAVDEERARELAEPEDQDYYGIGSRSSRFTLVLIIGIVFGTICPLMNAVVFLNFAVCRLFYGYLIPFAESRKNHSGGHHWCSQLHHVQYGVLIYIVMMVGVIYTRCQSPQPAFVSALSFLVWILWYRRFTRALQWEKVAFNRVSPPAQLTKGKSFEVRQSKDKKYFQRELSDDPQDWLPYKSLFG